MFYYDRYRDDRGPKTQVLRHFEAVGEPMVGVDATQHILVVPEVVDPVGTLGSSHRDLPLNLCAARAHYFGVTNPGEPGEKKEKDTLHELVKRMIYMENPGFTFLFKLQRYIKIS